MSSHEVFVEQFERLFHHYEEALGNSPESPAASQSQSRKTVASDDRNRMVAAARLAILEMETNARMEESSRKYFAKPGEAEWGC
jgi:hypothetical protein